MTALINVSLGLLMISALLCTARLVRRGSLADRIVGMDLLLIALAAAIVVDSARSGRSYFLDAVLVVSLIAFISTVAVAHFIERRGA